MASIVPGYNYDIFISYRQKDNKYDGWVTEFVDNLKRELEATFKEEVTVYFDINPHDGLLETHDVDASLKEKLKCLVCIPIISRTYCDPKSFAWEHEFKAFVEQASNDQFGLKVKLPGGNVASRVLPVRIHDLDNEDIKLCESVLGGVLRGVEFIYKESGFNRPLKPDDDEKINLNKTKYRNQITKVALAIKEIISGLKTEPIESVTELKEVLSAKAKPVIQEKSIIVLPFENMSPDPDQEYFSDGLTEEIITDLSHFHDLLVISRNSAMTFKGTKKKTSEIAHEVNVRYVLEGSVRKSGNNLRITGQLIDAVTDTHLWAEKYSGTLDDIFDIQEKVSRSIVDALLLKLTPKEEKQIEEHPIGNFQAYEYYLKSQAEIFKFTEKSIYCSIQNLKHALNIIGENVLLYSSLATAYFQLVNIGAKQEDYLLKAEEYVNKALSINKDHPKVLVALGIVTFLKNNPLKSVAHLKKALTFNPEDAEALTYLAATLIYFAGKISAAVPIYSKLIRTNPFDWLTQSLEGSLCFYDGQFDCALQGWQKLYEVSPENPYSRFWYTLILIYHKENEKAFSIIDQSLKTDPDNVITKLALIIKFVCQKNRDMVFKLMTPDFKKTCQRDATYSHHLAGFFALLNEKKESQDWLENAVNCGFINYPLLSERDPFLENIRKESRFKKLMKRVRHEWENFEV